MIVDLSERLQSALGDAYAVERELGGGGMSRLFIAQERLVDRRVVVKVLPPELAGEINAERFVREIHVAARLQHPHVVPLLSAGATDSFLYYTMPYIEGESLRQRLSRVGELPVPEAVHILRDVADALDYAHRHGVVHRDIKPENVLLSEHHALVADFGVAKAVSDAVAEGQASTLTGTGIALGTPSYMAPEQAAGESATDHRADLYALGVLAYELLSGRPPFEESSAQQLVAAHLTRRPVPLSERRPTAPIGLTTLVMRLLEKRPADRPQSADEVMRTLESVTTPSPIASTVPPSSRSRRWLAAALIGGLAVVGIIARRAMVHGRPAIDERKIIVVPFANKTGDVKFAALGDVVADWLSRGLAQSGLARVGDSRTAALVMAAVRGAGTRSGEAVRPRPWATS